MMLRMNVFCHHNKLKLGVWSDTNCRFDIGGYCTMKKFNLV